MFLLFLIEHKVVVDQPYATRVENLNPVLSFAWAGICKLSPSGDEWFEVKQTSRFGYQ